MGENEPGHRSCSEHISIELWSRRSREMENSIGLPVVNGFLMVELGSSKDTTRTDCSDLWMEDSLVHTQCCAVLQGSRAKDDKISTSDMTVDT